MRETAFLSLQHAVSLIEIRRNAKHINDRQQFLEKTMVEENKTAFFLKYARIFVTLPQN